MGIYFSLLVVGCQSMPWPSPGPCNTKKKNISVDVYLYIMWICVDAQIVHFAGMIKTEIACVEGVGVGLATIEECVSLGGRVSTSLTNINSILVLSNF